MTDQSPEPAGDLDETAKLPGSPSTSDADTLASLPVSGESEPYTAAATRRRAKTSNRWPWVTAGVAVLCVVAIVFGYSAYQSTSQTSRFKQADALFMKPYSDMARYATTNAPAADQVPQYFTVLSTKTDATRKGLADARAKVSALNDSAEKADYLATAVKLDAALTKIERLDDAWANADKIATDTQNVVAIVRSANASRETALRLVKSRDYASAKAKAKDALSGYQAAEKKIEQLDQQYPGLGIASLNGLLKVRIPLASTLLGVAEDYRAGDTTSAVKGRTKYNNLVDDLTASTQPAMAVSVAKTLAANWQKALKAASDQLTAAMATHDEVMARVDKKK